MTQQLSLTTDHWEYLLAQPTATALFKVQPEDFVVTEDLGYDLTGEGEHLFLWVEKKNLNTAYVAEALAKFTGIPLRNVTYAGRKDKYGVCRQWIGLHVPGNQSYDFSSFALEGLTILSQSRHNKKLRTGQLKGNHFEITLRDVSAPEAVIERLQQIRVLGVPNYYGEQRFGVRRQTADGQLVLSGNLALAQKMIAGEAIRNRNKRSMALSALRSWLFNQVISERLANRTFEHVALGDAISLSGSNSFFVNDGSDDTLQSRYQNRDVSPTAPLIGKGELATKDEIGAFEQKVLTPYQAMVDVLVDAGMKQERRSIRLWPEQLDWQQDDDTLTVKFSLPSGCFATSVLRECVITREPVTSPESE